MTGQRRPGKRVTTSPPVQTTDRRGAQRVPVQLMVRFSATDHFQDVGNEMALGLSENGCKLSGTEVLSIGRFRDLYLTIPETSRPILISEVRVIWVAKNECGIEFLRITGKSEPGYGILSGSR